MKSKLLVIATTALLFAACSDSFLDRAPEGNYVDATFYTSDEALEAATAPLYNRAWFDYNQRSIVPIGCMEWILLGSNDGELCNQCGRDADTG